MRKCPECEAEVTTYDKQCPQCKYPLVSEQEVAVSAAHRPRVETSRYKWRLFFLKFAQVLAVIGIALSFIYPLALLAMEQICMAVLSPLCIVSAFAWYYVLTVAIEYTEEKQYRQRQ
jgi:hypothetical protein